MSDYKDDEDNALSTIFQGTISDITATQITNYKNSADQDLGTRYLKGNDGKIRGVSGKVTGYEVLKNESYVDLGDLFEAALPFTAPNTDSTRPDYIFGTTAATTPVTSRYCYVIHTRVNSTATFTVNKPCTLNIICVGGGGGGGSPRDGRSCGGGGGGGVYKTTLSALAGYVIQTHVGSGGTGGGGDGATINVDGVGLAGGNSWVQYATSSTTAYNSLIDASGGRGGTTTGAGFGGQVMLGTTFIGISNGGDGGDEDGGGRSYHSYGEGTDAYPSRPLAIPTILTTDEPDYINVYYSGGGGGSRGDARENDRRAFSGGGGGGTASKNGNGGARGVANVSLDANNRNGYNGVGYGGGGGAGGQADGGTKYKGGNGKQGIVIIWATI